jgi:putative oxygen-independent coproporphyrinogen III oxidase
LSFAPARDQNSVMEPAGVYVQIPFCASKCSFCNFSSRVERPEVFAAYARALCQEVEQLPEIYARQGIDKGFASTAADTVYIGGGTPAILGIDLLSEITASLRKRFGFASSLEFTLETTPGSANGEFLRRARALGITRLSIGAQSFDDRELKAVGRLHSPAETRCLVETARQQGFRDVSLDLIAGLPFQTASSWQASLCSALSLRPEHISVYLFEIDSKSRLGNEVLEHGSRYHALQVPSEDFVADAYETARAALADAGYLQYEISNFALPGCESRHNRKYWKLSPYAGIGAGAHSFDGLHRWANVTAPEAYVEKIGRRESPIAEYRDLSFQELLEEFFFLGLRQKEGVDLETARGRWGRDAVERWEATISNLDGQGLLERRQERVSLTDRAYLISNEVFQEFLLTDSGPRTTGANKAALP